MPMPREQPFPDWCAVLDAQCSRFFRGHANDTLADRARGGGLFPSSEALYTQSNARVLIGQAANGSFRMIALPTQVYPAPTGIGELGLGPGMYHHFDVVMYAGDLSYYVEVDGIDRPIDLAADSQEVETVYADDFLPLTRTRAADLDVALISLAPVAPDARSAALAPAPLPGPAGALYVLYLRNTGAAPARGKVVLQAGDLLVGHYEDAAPAVRILNRPRASLRQHTLVLSRPDGAVGVHLHGGQWTRTEAPFQAERAFCLEPGEHVAFETHIAMGKGYHEVMPVIYGLHMRPALDWLNLTAAFWHARLGQLKVGAQGASEPADYSRDIYVRSLLDNFNCLQTDAEGMLIAHWQGAPSHGYGTVWGIDVEPTAVSIVHICPELARQALRFFATRSRAPVGPPDHSVPILVAPVIIARQWLQVTDDVPFLEQHPELMYALEEIMRDLLALRSPAAALFPTRFSSDGAVGRRYDYGTNVKVWYACESMAYLLRQLGRQEEADRYCHIVQEIHEAIEHEMVADGPFGPQISGGTNLNEDPGTFYLPEDVLYYDGEDTSSMLAPVYGVCDLDDPHWINYHRFARSLWCPNYDPEFGALRWSPGEFGAGALDGTGFFSRLGGSVTQAEMLEALRVLREIALDDATGSVFWWPHGLENKRALTRCSQGQGAWAWQYLQQWLGLEVDTPARTLTLAPRGLLSQVQWQGFRAGAHRFDIDWAEEEGQAAAHVRNGNGCPWTVQVGFRQPGTGATGALTWQTRALAPGESATFVQPTSQRVREVGRDRVGMDRRTLSRREAEALADDEGILFRRYGPAQLWGHWDASMLWDGQAMPLTIRLVLLNGTDHAWSDVSVELKCPAGWQAQGRLPQHWTRPDRLASGKVRLTLGDLDVLDRTVAAFWVVQPADRALRLGWGTGPAVPFHATSQPGDGITLYAASSTSVGEAIFVAELHARRADGPEIHRQVAIPVQIAPP